MSKVPGTNWGVVESLIGMIASVHMAERPAYVETLPRSWLGIMGQWRSADTDVSFVGADATWQTGGRQIGIGVAASDIEKFADGEITATISFGEGADSGFTAGLVLGGFRSFGDQFYYVEIGDQNGFRPRRSTSPW
jgi:hypothetical protein